MYVVTAEPFVNINVRICYSGYVHVDACTGACACIRSYSGCTGACNACPINCICIVMYAHDTCCYIHIHIYGVLLIAHSICKCFNILPSLCINAVRVCENAMICDMNSTSHHDCAVGNVRS